MIRPLRTSEAQIDALTSAVAHHETGINSEDKSDHKAKVLLICQYLIQSAPGVKIVL